MIWTPHTTVASVIEKEGRFLMIEELNSNGEAVINQPAGHLEEAESLIDAVIRETREETAWGFTPESLIGI
jgi:ADP-ribose pyrophosphatase YjhB (NUDIX family)